MAAVTLSVNTNSALVGFIKAEMTKWSTLPTDKIIASVALCLSNFKPAHTQSVNSREFTELKQKLEAIKKGLTDGKPITSLQKDLEARVNALAVLPLTPPMNPKRLGTSTPPFRTSPPLGPVQPLNKLPLHHCPKLKVLMDGIFAAIPMNEWDGITGRFQTGASLLLGKAWLVRQVLVAWIKGASQADPMATCPEWFLLAKPVVATGAIAGATTSADFVMQLLNEATSLPVGVLNLIAANRMGDIEDNAANRKFQDSMQMLCDSLTADSTIDTDLIRYVEAQKRKKDGSSPSNTPPKALLGKGNGSPRTSEGGSPPAPTSSISMPRPPLAPVRVSSARRQISGAGSARKVAESDNKAKFDNAYRAIRFAKWYEACMAFQELGWPISRDLDDSYSVIVNGAVQLPQGSNKNLYKLLPTVISKIHDEDLRAKMGDLLSKVSEAAPKSKMTPPGSSFALVVFKPSSSAVKGTLADKVKEAIAKVMNESMRQYQGKGGAYNVAVELKDTLEALTTEVVPTIHLTFFQLLSISQSA